MLLVAVDLKVVHRETFNFIIKRLGLICNGSEFITRKTVFAFIFFNDTVNCGYWNSGANHYQLEKPLEDQDSSEHPEPNSAVGR